MCRCGNSVWGTQGKDLDATWTQDSTTVTLIFPIDANTRGRDINLEVHPGRMRLTAHENVVMEGDFPERMNPDRSFFTIEEEGDMRMCMVSIEKKEMGHATLAELFTEDAVDTTVTHKVRRSATQPDLTLSLPNHVPAACVSSFRCADL